MKTHSLHGIQALVRIFVAESDKVQHRHASQVLLEKARAAGLAGCTVFRVPYGYGSHHRFHSELALEGSGDWSNVLELVDSPERLSHFLESIRDILSTIEAFATEEKVTVHHYGPTPSELQPESSQDQPLLPSRGEENLLLRIFIGESDQSNHQPLYMVLLHQARKMGLAGCTVLRGIAGFGASSIVHTPHLFRLSADLPIVLEVVDQPDRVWAYLKAIEPLLNGALVTEEKIRVYHYSAADKKDLDDQSAATG